MPRTFEYWEDEVEAGHTEAEVIFYAKNLDSSWCGKPRRKFKSAVVDAIYYQEKHPDKKAYIYAKANLTWRYATAGIKKTATQVLMLGWINTKGNYEDLDEDAEWLEI